MTSKKTREQRKKDGLCINCGKPKSKTSCLCNVCRDKANEANAKRREQYKKDGLCAKCGKYPPKENCTKCQNCLHSQMKAYNRRLKTHDLDDKQCLDCGGIAVGRCCETCHLKRVSVKRTGTVKNWKKLKQKFEDQNGFCPYTGRKLTIGVDAALDHIVPRSSGGSDDLENLQWVLDKANEMKWNYSENEFLELVEEIYKHRQKMLN